MEVNLPGLTFTLSFSDVLSTVAVLLSLFTFYFTVMRRKQSLILVRLTNFYQKQMPEFMLVNAGTHNLYVTSIDCYFKDNKGNSSAPSIIDISGKDNHFPIPPGEQYNCLINFANFDFQEFIIEDGVIINEESEETALTSKEMEVRISWVDDKGQSFNAACDLTKYSVNPNKRSFTLSGPMTKKADLYKKLYQTKY